MKKILFVLSLLVSFGTRSVFAQDKTGELLNIYYSLKDALVAGNTTLAAQQATAFTTAANTLKDEDRSGLVRDAQQITAAKDIEKQRRAFASLSSEMIQLVKATKTSGAPAYEMYCPMKKASWISKEQTVRNPYFGNSMLSCGSVTATLP